MQLLLNLKYQGPACCSVSALVSAGNVGIRQLQGIHFFDTVTVTYNKINYPNIRVCVYVYLRLRMEMDRLRGWGARKVVPPAC